MTAVCGPHAAQGACEHSVAQQLSTMPAWMYKRGLPLKDVPTNPWVPTHGHKDYAQGGELVDPSCEQMARHFGRVVGWYPGRLISDGQENAVLACSASLEMSTSTGPGRPLAARWKASLMACGISSGSVMR